MKRTAFLGTTAGALATLAATTPAAAETPFIVGALSSAMDAAIYYPLQQGWFKAAGLDVTVQPISAGPAAMAGVVGGSMQTADANVLSLAAAYSKGIPVVLIAPGASYTASSPTSVGLVAGPAVQSLKDLVGATVAVPSLQDLLTVSTKGFLEKNGVDVSSVHFIEIPPAGMPAALEAGRVNAVAAYDPFRSQAISQGGHMIGSPYVSIAPSFLVTAFFAHRPWVEANRQAAAAFSSVYARGAAYTNLHHNDLLPLVSSYSHVSLDVLHQQIYSPVPPALDPAMIQPVIDAAAKYHVIPEPFPAKDFIFSSRA